MTRLSLDPLGVLSAWEQMGGSAFSSDDLHPLDDPAAFPLDLSNWESSFKPSTTAPPVPAAPAATAPHMYPNTLLASFFTPAELGLAFLPAACCSPFTPPGLRALPTPPAAGAVTVPVTLSANGATAAAAQVVPHWPSTSSAGVTSGLSEDDIDGVERPLSIPDDADLFGDADAAAAATHGFDDDDGAMSLVFSDVVDPPSAAVLTSSPTSSSCGAGVVPEYRSASPVLPRHHHHLLGSTATSQQQQQQQQHQQGPMGQSVVVSALPTRMPSSPLTRLPTAQASSLPAAGSFFVPVSCGADSGVVNGSGCGVQMGHGHWCGNHQPQSQAQSQGMLLTVPEGGCGGMYAGQQEASGSPEAAPQAPSPPQQAAAPSDEAAITTNILQHPLHPSPPASKQQAIPQAAPQPHPARGHGSAAPSSAAAAAAASTPHIRTRAECLERYRQKKARRMFTKKIRYQLRKINADKRPRIKGRFVKKEELEDFLAAQKGGNRGGMADYGEDVYGMMDSDDE